MIETAHDKCSTCGWHGLEARRTALELGKEAWISEDGPWDSPRLHWARYQEEA